MARPSRSCRVAWLALVLSTAAAAAPTSRPVDPDLQSWVAQLDAPDVAVRTAAEDQLAAAGSRAIGVLTEARDDPRPEVSARAGHALRRVRLFALHGVPDAVLALADQYLSTGTETARTAVLAQLVEAKADPNVLVRLLLLEPDVGLRSRLLSTVGIGYRRAVAGLVADDDGDGLAALLDQAAAEVAYAGAADYAVHRYLTHRSDDAVDRWRAELANGDAAHRAAAAGVLCDLYRAADRPADAADMAARSQDWKLILPAALDRGDWHAAAAVANGWPAGKGAGMRAALNTLTGWEPGSVLLTLSGESDAAATDPDAIPIGKVRLLLGDVAGGLARLSASPGEGGDPVSAFGLLQARGEYDAALALAERFANDRQVGPAMLAARTKLRRLLGDLPPTTAPDPTGDATRGDAPPAPEDPHWTAAVSHLAARRFAAAAAELAAGDADPARIDWHYVRGYALDAAGDHDLGQRMMRSAELVPLADGARRLALAQRLDAAGLTPAAAIQRALAERAGSPFLEPVALLDLAVLDHDAAARREDWPAAAAAAGRIWLFTFWPDLSWPDPVTYLDVPAEVHRSLAEAARSRDDWTTAARELSLADGLTPLSTTAAVRWVPLLDAHGDHAGAEARFAAVYDRLDGAALRHPRSPYLHNQAAWLAACSCRRLDAALAHAQAAVDLTGGVDWQYLDTLAECRFRLGDRAAAGQLERRAIALAPPGVDGPYLTRQLSRFATAEVPSTTRPAAAPAE
jgi:tetratricopeptide (TPR) repeat protein